MPLKINDSDPFFVLIALPMGADTMIHLDSYSHSSAKIA